MRSRSIAGSSLGDVDEAHDLSTANHPPAMDTDFDLLICEKQFGDVFPD
jgi:hypothetical protein